nr:coatomer subunit gamma-2 [Quercus suber]
MLDMDSHQAGPSLLDVLTRQDVHRSSLLWDATLAGEVESQLRIIAKCEPGSEIYTNCINALQSVEELGRLTLDDARAVGNTRELAVRRGRQAGRRQGQGGRQSSQRPTFGRCPGVIHLCPHLVGVTHLCMTTPWRRQCETSQGTSEEKKTGMIFDGQLGEIFIENALLGKVDPTTSEIEDDGVEDEYQLEDLEVVVADYMLKVGVSNFRNAWVMTTSHALYYYW